MIQNQKPTTTITDRSQRCWERLLLALAKALLLALAVASLSACAPHLSELFKIVTYPAEEPSPTPPVVNSTPPSAEALQTLATVEGTALPERDLIALAQRLLGASAIPRVARETPYYYQVGDKERFWVSNTDTDERFEVTAVLQYITPHLYVWVQEEVQVDLQALISSAERFESQTYPTNRFYFGSEWSPGVDGDPHLNILHARGLGSSVGGYYASSDEFSRLAHPYSNEREMFYVNVDTVTVGSAYYDGLLAHEFQHMIHWHADRNEELWLNEGFSELAADLNGFDPGGAELAFLALPDVQMNDFDYDTNGQAHYGAAYLFALYFLERFGEDATRALVSHPENGAAGIEAVLSQLGYSTSFEDLFADWAVALYLDDPDLSDGRYGFRALDLPQPALAADISVYPTAVSGDSVHQFATDYIRLSGTQPVTVVLTGTRQVRLVSTDPHDGRAFWWSNRGDDADTTLTRAFDFSELEVVTLTYWLWYHIEENWDYAYLEVSTDDGRTWDTIQTPHTTDSDPMGNNYGHGYTGTSGGGDIPRWVHERIDLSAYAGQRVLLRFETITDGAIHKQGLVIDDLAIPELNFQDGFEVSDPAWEAAGFVRSENSLPQVFSVQLIELGIKPCVQRLQLDERGTARWQISLGAEMNQAVLIVSGVTPITLELAPYTYQVLISSPQ